MSDPIFEVRQEDIDDGERKAVARGEIFGRWTLDPGWYIFDDDGPNGPYLTKDDAKNRVPQMFMYVARCSDGTLYCGIAIDPEKRLEEHNACRGSKYIMPRRPARLVARWLYFNRSTASKAEWAFKKLKRAKKEHYLQNPRAWLDDTEYENG